MTQYVNPILVTVSDWSVFIWKYKYTDSLTLSLLISSVAINDSRWFCIIAEQRILIPLWRLWGPFQQTCFHLRPSNPAFPFALRHQAAADFAKAHLPEALRQQLLTYEREKGRDREKDKEKDDKREGGNLSYPSILEQQILNVDREMLDKLSATYNEAGLCWQCAIYWCAVLLGFLQKSNPTTDYWLLLI